MALSPPFDVLGGLMTDGEEAVRRPSSPAVIKGSGGGGGGGGGLVVVWEVKVTVDQRVG